MFRMAYYCSTLFLQYVGVHWIVLHKIKFFVWSDWSDLLFDQTAKRLNFYTNLDYVWKRILFLPFLCWLYMHYNLFFIWLFNSMHPAHSIIFGFYFCCWGAVVQFDCLSLDCCLQPQMTNSVQNKAKTDSWNQFTLHSADWNKEFAGRGLHTFPGICNTKKAKGNSCVVCIINEDSELALKQNWISCQGNICTVITKIFTLIKQKEILKVRFDLLSQNLIRQIYFFTHH